MHQLADKTTRGLGIAVAVLALVLSALTARYAIASWILFAPDTPHTVRPEADQETVAAALELAPDNATYLSWRSFQLQDRMRARWLEGETAVAIGNQALEHASRAIDQLPVDPYLYLRRATVLLDLARHPTVPDEVESSSLAAATADFRLALDLRSRDPELISRLADLTIRQWDQLGTTDPELRIDVLRRAALMHRHDKMRLENSRRLEQLWHTAAREQDSLQEAIGLMESVVPPEAWRTQEALERLFRNLARSAVFPRTSTETARELLERAATAAETRAREPEPAGDQPNEQSR